MGQWYGSGWVIVDRGYWQTGWMEQVSTLFEKYTHLRWRESTRWELWYLPGQMYRASIHTREDGYLEVSEITLDTFLQSLEAKIQGQTFWDLS